MKPQHAHLVWLSRVAAVLAMAGAFALMNWRIAVESILYRLAAADIASAAQNSFSLAVQALVLCIVLLLGGKLWTGVFLLVYGLSVAVNWIHHLVLGGRIDQGTVAWMLEEMAAGTEAALQFPGKFALGLLIAVLAVLLLLVARALLKRDVDLQGYLRGWHDSLPKQALLACAFLGAIVPTIPARAAHTNVWHLGWRIAQDRAPPREEVASPDAAAQRTRHIAVLVDESVEYSHANATFLPDWHRHTLIRDWGRAWSTSNCSTQSNVAIRWGLKVPTMSASDDIRRNPTIWQYAKAAGYTTVLIDGQTRGGRQNMLTKSELEHVDAYLTLEQGIDTDRMISDEIARRQTAERPSFTIAVLRGVHYQYHQHYPEGHLDRERPAQETYRKALAYSKRDFVLGLARSQAFDDALFIYTSDHGQNLTPGLPPHCSNAPVASEYSVPLVAFGGAAKSALGPQAPDSAPRHHAQIFPSVLIAMGYDRETVVNTYGTALDQAPVKLVRLGKRIIPNEHQPVIELFDNYPLQ